MVRMSNKSFAILMIVGGIGGLIGGMGILGVIMAGVGVYMLVSGAQKKG